MRLIIVLLTSFACGIALAEEEEVVDSGDEVRYVAMKPAFVCNFGGVQQGALKYLKAAISIRIGSRKAELAARTHMPALRNVLVLLLSRQDETSVSTGFGREAIRMQALEDLNGVLRVEEGQAYIEDLMFTNFIVQR